MYAFPPAEHPQECVLIFVPVDLVPIVGAQLAQLEDRRRWQTDQDWQLGYRAATDLQSQLMNDCLKSIIEGQERIYRLLDASMNGTAYEATIDPITGETIVAPAIPVVPSTSSTLPGLIARMTRMDHLLDNALNGTQYTGEFIATNNIRLLLTGIIDRLITGDPEGDALLEQVRQLLL